MADPWVAPDTQAPSAPPLAPTEAAPARPPLPATAPGHPGVPVPLRPLTVPDILDGGLRAFKLAPATMAGLAAVFVVPAQVLLGVVTRDAVDDVGIGQSLGDAFEATGPADVDTGLAADAFVLGLVAHGIALAFVTAAVARLVTGWYTGVTTGWREALSLALRRGWALVAAWVLVHVVEAAFAVLLVVPALVPMTWFAVVTPVIACEGAGPLRAMRRSYRLATKRFGAVLAVAVLAAVAHEALTGALSALGSVALELDVPAAWALNTAVAAAALLVTTPFLAGVATLLYLDLRVRTEGLDIELAARRRFGGS